MKRVIRKISTKLIFIISITSIIIISVYAYFSINFQSKVLEEESQRHLNQLSETIKNSTRDAMLENKRENIQKIVHRITLEPCIKKARIINKEGRIIYSSDSTEIDNIIDIKNESCKSCHEIGKPLERLKIKERMKIFKLHPDSTRMMSVINPIYNEKSCYEADCHAHEKDKVVLGVLDMTICLKNIDLQIEQSRLIIMFMTIITILSLGLILIYFIKRWVDRPVKDLVKATNKVALGNLSFEVKSRSNDELGDLSSSFNNMTKKLSEMRLQLLQSEKMASLGQLAAGIAHEINNPLTGVLSYSSYLLKRTKDNPELQNDLNVIVRETMRSREIVKQLLDFARQSTPKKIKININEIIERAEKVVANQLMINNINIEKNLGSDLPEIIIDPNQIQQVIINLIVNAIDAISKNGKITITTSRFAVDPYGFTIIKDALCPNEHSLMCESHKIDGNPSIKVLGIFDNLRNEIFLDPVYGGQKHEAAHEILKKKNINIVCPTCEVSFMDNLSKCPTCNENTYKIPIQNKGFLIGCLNKNHSWQKWEYIEKKGSQEYIALEIKDNGCGISEAKISRIFDPFFSTKEQKGTGLGLAVVWGIIDNHGGSISVESKIGEGTKFKIMLPLLGRV